MTFSSHTHTHTSEQFTSTNLTQLELINSLVPRHKAWIAAGPTSLLEASWHQPVERENKPTTPFSGTPNLRGCETSALCPSSPCLCATDLTAQCWSSVSTSINQTFVMERQSCQATLPHFYQALEVCHMIHSGCDARTRLEQEVRKVCWCPQLDHIKWSRSTLVLDNSDKKIILGIPCLRCMGPEGSFCLDSVICLSTSTIWSYCWPLGSEILEAVHFPDFPMAPAVPLSQC